MAKIKLNDTFQKSCSGPDGSGFEVLSKADELQMVFGFAMVCKVDGEPYFDTQGDHITEECILKSADKFMGLTAKSSLAQHKGATIGEVRFAYPLTEEIAKSHGIETDRTGLLVGIKIDDPKIYKACKDKQFLDFSIGGKVLAGQKVS